MNVPIPAALTVSVMSAPIPAAPAVSVMSPPPFSEGHKTV
jgi:hypothetical protein